MKKLYYTLLFLALNLTINAQRTTPIEQVSQEVGVTEGQLSVSLTGSATYTIPITVPPGINGVVPQVSLVYNSQGGNGMAGYGWNISGVSAITRIPSTKFHDGEIDPVDFDFSDRFALDGQRLVIKNGGNYFAASGTGSGNIYELENFSNIKISSINQTNSPLSTAGFKVSYPDGSFAIYGDSPNTRSATSWSISFWQNPQGVKISYSYILENNILRIESIKYGTTGTIIPINTISFVYKNREQPEQAYIEGQSVINNYCLSQIKVSGNGGKGFRNYYLSHDIAVGNERLTSITEKNGDNNKSYNSTEFNYVENPVADQITLGSSTVLNKGIGFQFSDSVPSATGDFDGDGDLDIVLGGQNSYSLYTKANDANIQDIGKDYSVTLPAGEKSMSLGSNAVKILEGNAQDGFKYKDRDALCLLGYTDEAGVIKSLSYNMYSIESGSNSIKYEYSKQFAMPAGTPSNEFYKPYFGDFNGDGLSDLMEIPFRSDVTTNRPIFFLNLSKKTASNDIKASSFTIASFGFDKSIVKVADVNGDGKSDLVVSRGMPIANITVYSLDNNDNIIKLFENSFSSQSPEYVNILSNIDFQDIKVGDFNGDGKSDFVYVGKYNATFMSTGNAYVIEKLTTNSALYREETLPFDYNNDGKIDLVTSFVTNTSLFIRNQTRISANNWKYYEYTFDNTTHIFDKVKAFMIKPSKIQDKMPEVVLFARNTNTLYYFRFQNHLSNQKLLKSITLGNNVNETISYSPLIRSNGIYTPAGQIANYPYIDIASTIGFQVVSMLEKNSAKEYKKQLFSYYGAVSNIEGLGFLGFRSTAHTNWHNDLTPIISTVSKFDPELRGANTENYTVLGIHAPLTAAANPVARIIKRDGNYTITGTENLTATQRITLSPNTWIQPGSTFSAKIIPEANKSSNTPDDFITKSILTYESDLLSNKVFKIQNTISKQYNALEDTNSETTTVYDAYSNPTQSTTLLKEGGTIVQTTVAKVIYDDQPTGSTYYIGRPTNKTQSVAVNGDTMTSEEQYRYENHLLTQIKKKGNNTDFIIEDNLYDTFGNIKTKTITAPAISPNPAPAPRITNYVYDPTGRFLKTSSDIEGLTTTFDYNLSSGVLNFEINPYGLKTTYEYDSWFKKTKTIDYLGKINEYFYTIDENQNTLVTTTGDDGSASLQVLDDLGRKIKTGTKDIYGNMSYVDYYYDIYGRNVTVSEPYFGASSTQFSYTKYDDYGRVTTSTPYRGKIVSIDYPVKSLITKVSDGSTTKTYTKNAIGNVVSMTDSAGGTINYTYYANGNLKSSNYDNVITTIEQDGWGRKTSLTDPSAGKYTYEYNGFGETTKETTPNGTTEYKLDDYGKLKTKNISGTSTSEYFYDGSSKLLTSSTFKDLKENTQTDYTYSYDDKMRIKSTIESNLSFGTKFTKVVDKYDAWGRIEYATTTAALNGLSSANRIKKTYKNGATWQIIDDITQRVLWQTNTVNERGQLTAANLGNGLTVNNDYDSYGFASQLKLDKVETATTNVMTFKTVFDPQKGNLTSRYNSLFNIQESFLYDSSDRLTTFNNLGQSYDARGRITQNTLGTYSYATSSKPYQNTQIELAPLNVNYYKGRPTQNITYNVFKSPVQIEEVGKDKISFTYNDDNNRSAMFYGGLQDDKSMRTNRKYYSSDGNMEIKYNKGAPATEFITYIGGDSYTAPIVLKSDGTTQNYLYLHRDYLGSLLAITDAGGAVIEKRHFDAWGGIVKVQNGAGVALTGLTVLDCGYTGHEHLKSVSIINMNGRLYDSMLHRFLQPDNNIQDPFNTQNYNRYGYVLNNPLKYTDPSGESIGDILGFLFSAYVHGGAASGGQANPLKWDANAWTNAFAGASSSVVSYKATEYGNGFIDSYNKPPELGASASSGGSSGTTSSPHVSKPYTWNDFTWDLYLFGSHMDQSADKWGPSAGQFIAGFHPLVCLVNSFNGYKYGSDIYGKEMGKGGATFEAAMAVAPFIKIGKLGIVVEEVAPKGVGGIVDFVAGVEAKSFGKVVGEGTVYVSPTINAIESGTLKARNAFGYLNKEGHALLNGKTAGYWQEYHLLEFGSKSPLRILRGGKGEYFLSPDHYKSIIPLNY
jgi:RHS repeat-associated protein